ncbi:unnamed protein product [Schistosoma spindalis]|nr:unnamed protein product [Schistosoma spindale]
MTDVVEARRCFGCRVIFETDDEFWHHILNVDCSSSISSPSLGKDVSLPCSSQDDNRPLKSTPSDDLCFCGLCDKWFVSKPQFLEHFSSAEHEQKSKLATQVRFSDDVNTGKENVQSHLFCDIRQRSLSSAQTKEAHLAGKNHNKMCNRQSSSVNTQGDSHVTLKEGHTNNQEVLERLVGDYGQSSSKSFENSHSSDKNTSHVVPQFCTDDEDDIIRLLRRLCLTQILSLLLSVSEDSSAHVEGSCNKVQSKYSLKEKDLLELTRTICKEELRAILPHSLQHVISQTKNAGD